MTRVPALVLGLLFAASAGTAAPPPLDPALPYQAEAKNPVRYQVDYQVVITAPYKTKRLRVWLPVPPSDAVQRVEGSELTTFPDKVAPVLGTEPVYGNTFAYFEFANPEGAQVIRHTFTLTASELHWKVDPKRITKPAAWPEAFKPYLGSDAAVAVTPEVAHTVTRILRDRTEAAYDLDAVMGWLQENMTYDHGKASLKADSRRALETKTGHCSDYHGLCSAFGRALGLPTRVTYGINTFPKASPSHCKMEAFLPPYGWVSFDVSETQRLVQAVQADATLAPAAKAELAAAVRDRLKGGFRDNTWFLQTRGTDYDLVPPASKKVNVVRTIYAEADGKPLADPDPSDPAATAFAWMTAIRFTPDRPVSYPFKDYKSLLNGGVRKGQ